ncbi:MAG: hypothetical protein QGD91_07125, partial [Actinomycetota bacterium]|nr:hypothetical protein [Actinomycetota bacterium]
EVESAASLCLMETSEQLWLDAGDRRDAVDALVERHDPLDTGPLGGGREVRLGVVETVGFVHLQ